jgi:fibro-slime domain-containing protein
MRRTVGACAVVLAISGCGTEASSGGAASGGASSGGARNDGGPPSTAAGGSGGAPSFSGFSGRPIDVGGAPSAMDLPANFTPADIGGYALGAPAGGDAVTGGAVSGADGGSGCDVMMAIVRDFKGINEDGGHPDFEAFDGKGATTGLLESTLGADRKPVYASHCEAVPDKDLCPYGQMTTSKADFDQWYRFTDGVNKPFVLYLKFDANNGVYTFASKAFFPLDNAGWGNSPHKSHHNFGFTTELHTRFQYNGGEQFSFTGDDDLWVFVNGKLAIDLGGLHPSKSQTLDLDASAADLGIVPGSAYDLELFHAERHSASSNFRVDTTLSFTNCGTVVPEIR